MREILVFEIFVLLHVNTIVQINLTFIFFVYEAIELMNSISSLYPTKYVEILSLYKAKQWAGISVLTGVLQHLH